MSNISLNPYRGSWTYSHAVHLLSRTVFGYKIEQVNDVLNEGLVRTIEKLMQDIAMPDPPVYYNFDNDPNVPNGESWVYSKAPRPAVGGLSNARKRSVRAWQIGQLHEGGLNIREKMVLFWHEHMPIAEGTNPRAEFQYLDILRRNATGNFRTLIEEITIAPSILIYLNGNENTKEAPNENYARELLELFTIGRGEAVGDGDYTNYTEEDIVQMSRALTGWRTINVEDDVVAGSTFVSGRHDAEPKQLSHRFNNVVINDTGANEYKLIIDIILQKKEVSRFICRKMHIWFVNADITPEVESNIIEPMAAIMRSENYGMKGAITALLSSMYFHDIERRGCMLSSPIDFFFKTFNTIGIPLEDNVILKYSIWYRIYNLIRSMQMDILNLPTVAGWKAYYQAPQYYQYWINSVSLNQRFDIINTLNRGFSVSGSRMEFDYLGLISKLKYSSEPNPLIEELAELLFVAPISQNQKDYLKEILIPGLPDFEWTLEYSNYLGDPTDEDKMKSVEAKIKALVTAMTAMPEYYLL